MKILYFLIIISLLLSSCKKSDTIQSPSSKYSEFILPTDLGHSWKYSYEYTEHSRDQGSAEFTQWGFRYWKIISKDTLNDYSSYTIESIQSDSVHYLVLDGMFKTILDTTYTIDSVGTFLMNVYKDSTVIQWNNLMKEKNSNYFYPELCIIPNENISKIDTLIVAKNGSRAIYKNGTGLIDYYFYVGGMSHWWGEELKLLDK